MRTLPIIVAALTCVASANAALYNINFTELGGGAIEAFGQINVEGTVAVSGFLTVSGMAHGEDSDSYTLTTSLSYPAFAPSGMAYDNTVNLGLNPSFTDKGLLFTGVPNGHEINIQGFSDHYILTADYAYSYEGNVTLTAVPEPSTYLAGLSSLGMLGLLGWRRRK